MQGVSVNGNRKLSLSDPETKFVVCFVPRRYWVVTKKQVTIVLESVRLEVQCNT